MSDAEFREEFERISQLELPDVEFAGTEVGERAPDHVLELSMVVRP